MNQSRVGDRHRYQSYLTRTQIGKVTDRCNWGGQDYTVCSLNRAAGETIKRILKALNAL
jgi:hypothetical protein